MQGGQSIVSSGNQGLNLSKGDREWARREARAVMDRQGPGSRGSDSALRGSKPILMVKMKSRSPGAKDSEVLVAAIEKILHQLTKLLIHRMSLPKYLSLVRKIYVEEAENQLRREGRQKDISMTDLGLITGIDTRTLAKVRESDDYRQPISQSKSFFTDLTPEAAVLDKWCHDPEFAGAEGGMPSDLEIWGEGKTFEALVQSTIKSRGITVQSILNRLTASGTSSISEDGKMVSLHPGNWTRYQVSDVEGMVKSGLLGVSKHLDTVINNINSVSGSVPPRFERIFWSNRLDPRRLEEFRESIHRLLEELSDEAVKHMEPFDLGFDLEDSMSGGVGLYYFDSDIS